MKHIYSIPKFNGFSEELLNKVFPENFDVKINGGEVLLSVECDEGISDSAVLKEIQRELDRLSFFIGHEISGHKKEQELENGLKVKYVTISTDLRTVGGIPENLDIQNWSPELEIQLCLWRLTRLKDIPYAAKINMLFQIIEVCYPDTGDNRVYPTYNDVVNPPHPLTESLLLRNLVSHRKTTIGSSQLQKYCQFLDISVDFHNPTKKNEMSKIIQRIKIIQDEARKIINDALTYK